MHKPRRENAFEKALRLKESYRGTMKEDMIPAQIKYHWNQERSMSLQIIDILYRDIWKHLPPGIKFSLFNQTQMYLRRHYDNVEITLGKCIDVYGRVSPITEDWLPETNEVLPKDYEQKYSII